MLLTPVQMRPQTPGPRGAQTTLHSPSPQPDWARDLFELQHGRPELKRGRPTQNGEQGGAEHRPGGCMADADAKGGAHATPAPSHAHQMYTGPAEQCGSPPVAFRTLGRHEEGAMESHAPAGVLMNDDRRPVTLSPPSTPSTPSAHGTLRTKSVP